MRNRKKSKFKIILQLSRKLKQNAGTMTTTCVEMNNMTYFVSDTQGIC